MANGGNHVYCPVAGKILTPGRPCFPENRGGPGYAVRNPVSVDMGGYPLAVAMTDNSQVQILSGVLLSAMMVLPLFYNPGGLEYVP